MKEYWGLDLFCCAGGATRGYQNAGFKMVGIDHKPQKRYVGEEFIQADALEYLDSIIKSGEIDKFDFVHASPPCQANTTLRNLHKHIEYEDLIPFTRPLLIQSKKPWVMENVVGADLLTPIILCGSMFGLQTDCGAELQRHRLFEISGFYCLVPDCRHGFAVDKIGVNGTGSPLGSMNSRRRVLGVYGDHVRDSAVEWEGRKVISIAGDVAESRKVISVNGHTPVENRKKRKTISVTGSTPQQNVVRNIRRKTYSVIDARKAMGIDWMSMAQLSQAIPPAYTEFIGNLIMEMLRDKH